MAMDVIAFINWVVGGYSHNYDLTPRSLAISVALISKEYGVLKAVHAPMTRRMTGSSFSSFRLSPYDWSFLNHTWRRSGSPMLWGSMKIPSRFVSNLENILRAAGLMSLDSHYQSLGTTRFCTQANYCIQSQTIQQPKRTCRFEFSI